MFEDFETAFMPRKRNKATDLMILVCNDNLEVYEQFRIFKVSKVDFTNILILDVAKNQIYLQFFKLLIGV